MNTAPDRHPMTPTDRFRELRDLLRAYESTGHAFDDTLEAPGAALSSYLRTSAFAPGRAEAAAREIDDLLAVGLFSDEIADDVDLLPHIEPPRASAWRTACAPYATTWATSWRSVPRPTPTSARGPRGSGDTDSPLSPTC